MIKDDPSQIKSIFETLRQNFATGQTKDLDFREAQLRNLLKGIAHLENNFHEAIDKDLGTNKFSSWLTSITTTVSSVKYNLDNFKSWAKKRPAETSVLLGPAKSYLVPEPFGVVLVLGAWNYPLTTSIPYVASAIAAGNAVLLKPSELAPYSSNAMVELFKFLDNRFYQIVEGGGKVAQTLTALPFDLIVFTGSPEKGKLVAKAAAENLTPCILELGGKSPTIVDKGANIDNAALRIASGRWMNCGQTCIAPDYLLVHKDIKKEFVEKLKKTIDEFYQKNPKGSQDYGKIINEGHSHRLKGYLEEKHGGTVIYGDVKDIDVKERYVPPFIVDNPLDNSKMMQDEIFGPILPIIDIESIDGAIKYINAKPKPLALYYYGPILSSNKEKLLKETSSGAVVFNESVFHFLSEELPFGGVGNSGMGVVHGKGGFDSVSHLKPVMDKLTLNSFPFSARFPPYTNSKQSIMKLLFSSMNFTQKRAVYVLLLIGVLVTLSLTYRNGTLNPVFEYLSKFLTALVVKKPSGTGGNEL